MQVPCDHAYSRRVHKADDPGRSQGKRGVTHACPEHATWTGDGAGEMEGKGRYYDLDPA